MKKVFALLIAFLVVLQVFFIPVLADENHEEEPEDLLHSSVSHDLDIHTGADLLDLVGGTLGAGNIRGFELVSAAYERAGNSYRFYLYLLERKYVVGDPTCFKIGLKNQSNNSTFYVDAALISSFGSNVYKVTFDLPMTSPCITRTTDSFSIELRSIQKVGRDWSDYVFEAYREQSGDSVVVSNLGLTFSYNDIMVVSMVTVPMLDLPVTLMSYRAPSDTLGVYNQLNTAAFIVPDYFTDHYGTLKKVSFQYDIYHDVPMFVVEKELSGSFYNFLRTSAFNSSDYDLDFNPAPAFKTNAVFPAEFVYNFKWWLWNYYTLNYADYGYISVSPYFVFAVDEINHSEDGKYDFTPEQGLQRFQFIKDHSAPPYTSNVRARELKHIEATLSKSDLYNTASAAENLSWYVEFAARLAGYGSFLDGNDIQEVQAIEHVESDPGLLSDDQFESGLYVDYYFKDTLSDLYGDAEDSGGLLTLLRYNITPYSAGLVNSVKNKNTNTSYSCDGYLLSQDIIDNFEIISLEFEPVTVGYDGPRLLTTTVLVHSDPQSYVGGGQSPDSMDSPWTLHFLSAPKSAFDWLKRIGLILVAVILVIVFFKVVSFFVAFVSLFRRRRSQEPDQKPKKKRFRLFGRRKE